MSQNEGQILSFLEQIEKSTEEIRPKCDTSLDSVSWAEHFDIILDHFRPEPDHFWPTPDRSGGPSHVIHRWTQNIELNILILTRPFISSSSRVIKFLDIFKHHSLQKPVCVTRESLRGSELDLIPKTKDEHLNRQTILMNCLQMNFFLFYFLIWFLIFIFILWT
jgi:hypothetical protein